MTPVPANGLLANMRRYFVAVFALVFACGRREPRTDIDRRSTAMTSSSPPPDAELHDKSEAALPLLVDASSPPTANASKEVTTVPDDTDARWDHFCSPEYWATDAGKDFKRLFSEYCCPRKNAKPKSKTMIDCLDAVSFESLPPAVQERDACRKVYRIVCDAMTPDLWLSEKIELEGSWSKPDGGMSAQMKRLLHEQEALRQSGKVPADYPCPCKCPP